MLVALLVLLLLLGAWIYSDTLNTPDSKISRGILQNALNAETIEQNISNRSQLVKLNEDTFALGYLEKGSLSFDFYDKELNKVNQLETAFKRVSDFAAIINKDKVNLFTIADKNIRKSVLDMKSLERIGQDIRIDTADFMKLKDGYLVYGNDSSLGLVYPDGKTYIYKINEKVIDADIYINDQGVKIVFATKQDMQTQLKYTEFLDGNFSSSRNLISLSTDINRKLRNLSIESDDKNSMLIYGIKDSKSQSVAYNTLDLSDVNSEPVSIADMNQDSPPIFYEGTNQMILLKDEVRGNNVYTQVVIEDIKSKEVKMNLTKGKITAYNPEIITLGEDNYLKYENVMANKKEIYLASSKPSLIKKTLKPSVDEMNAIISNTFIASIFGYVFSLSYFGYIFIFIALLFFCAMLFFVSWTERNPHKIIIGSAIMHLIAQIMTMNSFLIQNPPTNISLPFYVKNPLIVIAIIVLCMIISLMFIFFRHTKEEMKVKLWGTYFEFFTVNTMLYMLIFFPYLAFYYI